VERTRAQINYLERATAFVPSAGVDLPRNTQLISFHIVDMHPVNRMHVNAQPDFTGSFSFTWHSFYLSKSGSTIRFLERRARSLVRKKLRLQIPVEPEFAKAQPDFTRSFFFTWHSFYLSKSGSAIRFLEH